LREALVARLICDEELWLDMLKDRNSTAHIYNEQLAIKICNNIQGKYANELKKLADNIQLRISQGSKL